MFEVNKIINSDPWLMGHYNGYSPVNVVATYVYGGKGTITSGESAIKYETESVSGFGLFGLLGMVWEGLEGLIGVRYYSTNYTDFNSTNTSEVSTLGKPYAISDAQLIFGLGYSF